MSKKYFLLLVIMSLLLFVSCTDNNGAEEKKDDAQAEENINDKKISVLLPYYQRNDTESMLKYLVAVAKAKGYEVEYKTIAAPDYENFVLKRNIELFKDDGYSIVLFNKRSEFTEFEGKNLFVDIESNIDNLSNVENFLVEPSFVPIAMYTSMIGLNKDKLEEIGESVPSDMWTKEDYFRIVDEYQEYTAKIFTQYDYYYLATKHLSDVEYISNGVVSLSKADNILEKIDALKRDIFNGYYITDSSYSYSNYKNMIGDRNSEESKKYRNIEFDYKTTHILKSWNPSSMNKNPLSPLLSNTLFLDDTVILYDCVYGKPIQTPGVAINRSGKNTDIALDFINDLLSDEMQLLMYEKKYEFLAPVIVTIDEEIKEINEEKLISERAIEFRRFLLENHRNDNFVLAINDEQVKYYNKFKRDLLIDIIFSDEEMSDQKIMKLLKEFDNETNLENME